MIYAKPLAAAAALAGLLAAGCGSKPEPAKPKPPGPASPAKSEAPPLPAPPKPAGIAWGEAVNGLQVGLEVVGGEEEMRLRRIADLTRLLAKYTGPEHKMPVVQALDQVSKDRETGAFKSIAEFLFKDVAAGYTFSEALQRCRLLSDQEFLDGVKTGEAAGDLPAAFARLADVFEKKARPRGVFSERKRICAIVRLRNVSEKEATLPDSSLHYALGLTFAHLDGGPTILCYPKDLKKRVIQPLVLPAKGRIAVEFCVENRWAFEERGAADGGGHRLTSIPPGRYAMTASCMAGLSGPVEIEIKALAVSEARAREIALKELEAKYPHTKWRLDHMEVTDDRVWRGSAQDAEPKPAMNSAVIDVDTDTGQVTWLQFYPGR